MNAAVYGEQSSDHWLPSFYILQWLKLPEKSQATQKQTETPGSNALTAERVCAGGGGGNVL